MRDFSYLTGVYNIAPTPFHPDGALDEPSIQTLVDFVAGKGVDGMTILGVMGETSKVSDVERGRIIEAFLKAADGRIPICVGTTHAATGICITYSKQAQAMGAQAVMVAPPALKRGSPEALRRHYLAVAGAIELPVVVQDHPPSSGVVMSVDFIARLVEEAPQCRFIKMEDEPAPPKVAQILAANPNAVVFGGTGGMMFLEELRRGAVGTMTGFAFPDVLASILQKFQSGDEVGAAEHFYRYCPLIRFENQTGINLALRKHIYALRGAIASPTVREPYARFDAEMLDDLERILEWVGYEG